ncbi:general secretion pathway protein GspF [Ectothiorhodospira shaposhnikovii]|uniref:type II secretion system F family protein n=1 Tax=Ectothiorhodospira shaposhnikovii TaxID=1054 RepID=UPI001904E655|nr:type II secretion system F family protein [Ectothiorhodospira shaposhnikovii]MBK1672624.1 general secretion pathway protein GspF [Ectothiorhodospira shaposhnikovii]
MALWYYKSVAADGEVVEGEMEAPDEATLIRRLQEAGQIPVRTREGGRPRRLLGARAAVLSRHDIGYLTHSLATLLGAGLPLDRALVLLADLAEHPRQRQLVERVLSRVRGGEALSVALEAQGPVFSRFYINMIRAGEAGGSLDAVLHRLAEYQERAEALRQTVTSALIYPAILVTLSVASVLVLLIYVVPQFTDLFEDAGQALPTMTRVTVGAAEFIREGWWKLLLGLLVILLGFRQVLESPALRRRWDRLVLRLPRAGDLVAKLEVARFSRTMGTLLGNGVPALSALAITRDTLTNSVFVQAVSEAAEQLREGRGIAAPLEETGVFPRLGLQMIRLGEETGQLEEMLHRIATLYDQEVQLAVKRLLTLLEPVLIVGLGLVIGGIIMSIMVAILGIQGLAF